MPVDYSLGKVYKIVGNGKVYVGSTCERLLCQRLAGHKKGYKRWIDGKANCTSSSECITDPECYIELLEVCPCSCIDELRKCEGKWIRDLDCVNRRVSGQTQKDWREANKEYISERHKAYYEANREKQKEYMKAYYLKKKAEQ
jgi:hypothetical protein